jgi:transcriptional regulator with XRE-family HTH domain
VRGLRREEVAQLAGISLAWYTLFETARDIRVSPRALDRLAKALRLNDGEKAYLFSLAIDEIPSVPRSCVDDVGAVGKEYVGLQILTRRLRAASSLQEVEHASIEFLFAHARPELAMFVHADLESKELWFTTQCPGSGIEPQSGQRYPDSMVNDFEPVFERATLRANGHGGSARADTSSPASRRENSSVPLAISNGRVSHFPSARKRSLS